MTENTRKKLLDIPEVIDEINRHLWIESEKAGCDIGFEAASRDWMNKYADEWVSYYLPKKRESKPKEMNAKKVEAKATDHSKRTRGRSAKHYA